ncbi:MAG: MFS transporter [Hyphomicrobiales bacterium]|nr:MFS transporter [Hyphomicrobiales bacterium]
MNKLSGSTLYNKNLLKFICLTWFSHFALKIISLTVGWQIYMETGSPLALGLVGLIQFAPQFFLILPAGVLADKYNRRHILIASNLVQVFVAGFLLYYSIYNLDKGSIIPIYLILILHGIAMSFAGPSSFAILPNLVKKEIFPRAVHYVNFFEEFGSLFGPIIAGILIAYIDKWVYLVALISFAIATLSAVSLPDIGNEIKEIKRITAKVLLSGFVYVWKSKIVLGTMAIDIVAMLFSSIMGMLPIFAIDILNIGPEGLGILRATPSIGALFAAMILSQMSSIKYPGRVLIYSIIVFGCATIIFSLSTSLWISLSALFIYGASDMVSMNIRQIIVQLVTPNNMRGRVMSVHSVITTGSNELGDFRAGLSAALIGIVPAIMVGGIFTISLSVVWWFLFPGLKEVKDIKDLNK